MVPFPWEQNHSMSFMLTNVSRGKANVVTCSPGVLSFTPTDGRVFHHAPPHPDTHHNRLKYWPQRP